MRRKAWTCGAALVDRNQNAKYDDEQNAERCRLSAQERSERKWPKQTEGGTQDPGFDKHAMSHAYPSGSEHEVDAE